MKKLIVLLLIAVSNSVIAQTNYNTIMNPKKCRNNSINLHLEKAKVLNKVGNVLAFSAIGSAAALFYLNGNKNNDLKPMFFIPLSIGTASLFTFHLAGKQELKAMVKGK